MQRRDRNRRAHVSRNSAVGKRRDKVPRTTFQRWNRNGLQDYFDVAATRASGYFVRMHLRADRRFIALLTVMLLSLGLAAQGVMAADMGAKVTAASAGAPSSQNCDACGGDERMPEVVCYGVCSNSTTVLPHPAPVNMVALGQSNSRIGPAQTSQRAAPDPYPPKPTVLN